MNLPRWVLASMLLGAFYTSVAQAAMVVARPMIVSKPVVISKPVAPVVTKSIATKSLATEPAVKAKASAVIIPHATYNACSEERRRRKECT